MRAVECLLGLCLLAGLSVCSDEQYTFRPGQTYSYAARGRLMTGISEINTQYSGMELEYNVDIVVTGPTTFIMTPSNFRVSEVHDILKGGWREGELQGQTPVDISPEVRQYFQSPIEVTFSKGIVKAIKVQGDLPTWAVNMKKAQVSHYVIDTAGVNTILPGNLNRPTNHVRPSDAASDSGLFYETMEETILGECKTYYTVSQTGPFPGERAETLKSQYEQDQDQDDEDQQNQSQSSEETRHYNGNQNRRQYQNQNSQNQNQHSQYQQRMYNVYKQMARRADSGSDINEDQEAGVLIPEVFHGFCGSQSQLYEITKTVNYTTCKNKPVLGYVSPALLLSARPGDNNAGSAINRIAYSRYIACGQDRKQLTILKIEQEEQYNAGPLQTEKIVGGSIKNLTLTSIRPTSDVPVPPPNPKEITDLTYTFDPKEQKLRTEGALRTPFDMDNQDQDQEQQEQEQDNENEFESEENSNGQYQHQGMYNRKSPSHHQKKHQKHTRNQHQRPRRSASSQEDSEQESQEYQDESQNRRNGQYHTDAEGEGNLPQPSLMNPPMNPMKVSPLSRDGMKARVGILLDEIIETLTDKKSLAEEEVISTVNTVSKILRYFRYADIEELYYKHADKEQTAENQISRNIFFDAVAMAGTNPNIKLLIDLMSKNKIYGEEAAQLIMTFPMYIATPTNELLKYFFEKLVDVTGEPYAPNDPIDQVKTTAVLAFSNVLHDACINTRSMNSRYPVALYGEFCNQEFVERNFLQPINTRLQFWLEKDLSSQVHVSAKHWLTVYLTALGNIGHPASIKQVQIFLDNVDDSYIKTKAVYVLKRMTVSRSSENIPINKWSGVDRQNRDVLTDEVVEKQVLPILVSVAFDKTEYPEVRMAAISLLIRTTGADIALWQQLAYMTWFELSREVHSFVYTTLKSLAALERPVDHVSWKAQANARTVLSLAKPILGGWGKSRSGFASEFVEEYQSGFNHHWAHFGARDSLFPSSMHYKNYKQVGNNGFGSSPLQFSIHGQSIQQLVRHVMGKFSLPSQGDIDGNEAIKQIVHLLNIADREQDEEPQADLQLKLQNEMERIFSVNAEVIDQYIQNAKRSYFPKLLTGLNFNYQKTLQLHKVVIETPTIFGIPATMKYRSTVFISMRGNMKAVPENGFRDVQLQLEIHPIFARKEHACMSFKSPLTGKKYQAGVQRHLVAEAPLRAHLRKDRSGLLEFAISPGHLQEGTPSGSIQFLTFHRRPYTAVISDEFWPTCHKEGGEMKIVHALETPFRDSRKFGEDSLAMNFRLEQMSEFRPEREEFPAWTRHFQRFESMASFFHVGMFGAPTVRLSERKLILDVSQSKTKTLFLLVAGRFRNPFRGYNYNRNEQADSSSSSEESSESQNNQPQFSTRQQQSDQSSNERQYDGPNSHKYAGNYMKQQNYYKQQLQKQYQKYTVQQQQNQNQDSQEESYEDDFEGQFQFPKHWHNRMTQYQSQESSEENQGRRSGSDEAPARYQVVIALIGKTNPIQSPLKTRGIQKLVSKTKLPSTVHYVFSARNLPGRVAIRFSAGSSTKEAARQLPQNSAAVEAIRQILVNSPLSANQRPLCIDYNGNYDGSSFATRRDLLVLRQRLLKEDLKVKVQGALSFGDSCENQANNISFKGELRRGEEMTEFARTKSVEAQKCNEDEKKGFFTSPVCIWASEQQAAALNEATFEFRSTRLPLRFMNATIQAREFFQAKWFKYMSYNPFPALNTPTTAGNEDSSFRMTVEMTPDFEFLTLRFFQPMSTLFFENIRTNNFIKSLIPLTATQSLQENFSDRVFRTDSQASCSIESNFVSTFDNITYQFDKSVTTDCYHVLAQDCSGRNAMSVLAKEVGNSILSTTVLLPSNFRIELNPVLRSTQNQNQYQDQNQQESKQQEQAAPTGPGRVRVNGAVVHELPTTVLDKNGEFIARIEQAADGSLQLRAKRVQLTTDGRHIVIYGSNALRNATCGLCGNFDGEKTVDLRSPKNCPLSSGSLLVGSYAFQSPNPEEKGECKVDPAIRKAIDEEERDCESQELYLPTIYAGSSCKEKITDAVANVVYGAVKTALKPIPLANGKKWAGKAEAKARELMSESWNAKTLADILSDAISRMIPVLGGTKLEVNEALRAVCKTTGCCDDAY